MKITLDDLPKIVLAHGAHSNPQHGMCLLEAAALFAGEKFSDSPECVDPVLADFGRSWNDGMRSDEEREQLKPYIPLIVGTAGSADLSNKRSWMAFDWLVRVHTVAWLTLSPSLARHAETLAALPEITCSAQLDIAVSALKAAQKDAAARAAAARAAAWAAARAAARAAAWAAARAAAWDAAGAAARAAAWDAARDAAWDAAGAAARAAAWDAARDAAGEKLKPTTVTLQASAHVLFKKMIEAKE